MRPPWIRSYLQHGEKLTLNTIGTDPKANKIHNTQATLSIIITDISVAYLGSSLFRSLISSVLMKDLSEKRLKVARLTIARSNDR